MRSTDGRFEYLDLDYEPVPPGTPPEQMHRFGFRCPRGKGGAARGEHAGMCTGLNLARPRPRHRAALVGMERRRRPPDVLAVDQLQPLRVARLH